MSQDIPSGADTLPDHAGGSYLQLLQNLHQTLKPRSYLEIGSRTGASLSLASCRSIAIDPTFKLNENFFGSKPACLLFQLGSDEFFAHNR